MKVFGRTIDERFLSHRRRSTSTAGIAGGIVAALLFTYYYYARHELRWDLFIILITIVVVKLALMAWYLITE